MSTISIISRLEDEDEGKVETWLGSDYWVSILPYAEMSNNKCNAYYKLILILNCVEYIASYNSCMLDFFNRYLAS